MKIYLFKKENDEEVYYKIDETEEEYILNFEKIKELSKEILNKKLEGIEFKYETEVQDNSLDIYKTTLDNVFKSIIEDEDLFELYKENSECEITEDTTENISDVENDSLEIVNN